MCKIVLNASNMLVKKSLIMNLLGMYLVFGFQTTYAGAGVHQQ